MGSNTRRQRQRQTLVVVGADEELQRRLQTMTSRKFDVRFLGSLDGTEELHSSVSAVVYVIKASFRSVLSFSKSMSQVTQYNKDVRVGVMPVGKSRMMSKPSVLQSVSGATVLDPGMADPELQRELLALALGDTA